jgi:hypothetical protein
MRPAAADLRISGGSMIQAILQRPVDVIAEPVRKDRLRRRIEEDRVIAF